MAARADQSDPGMAESEASFKRSRRFKTFSLPRRRQASRSGNQWWGSREADGSCRTAQSKRDAELGILNRHVFIMINRIIIIMVVALARVNMASIGYYPKLTQ